MTEPAPRYTWQAGKVLFGFFPSVAGSKFVVGPDSLLYEGSNPVNLRQLELELSQQSTGQCDEMPTR